MVSPKFRAVAVDPFIPPYMPRVIVRYAEHHGVDPIALCTAGGIDPSQLADDEARLPLASFYDLLEALVERTGDARVGLRIAGSRRPEEQGLVGFLVLHSATVGHGVARMLRFQRLLGPEQPYLRHGERTVAFCLQPVGPTRRGHEVAADGYVVETLFGLRSVCGQAASPVAVGLQHPRPVDGVESYVERLGIEPEFGAADNYIAFPASLMDTPILGANPALGDVLEQQAALRAKLLPDLCDLGPHGSLADRVSRFIVECLPDGAPTLQDVAQAMAMSPRSLQRQLHSEQTSLRQIVDQVREQLARQHVAAGHPNIDIALRLGFSDLTAFYHAFKRWTGTTPAGYRGQDPHG